MDGDMQHPTHKVSELVEKLEKSDLAIGTRHNEDGEVEEWTPKRKLISLFGKTYSKTWIQDARQVSDPMSGFFAVNLDKINLNRLNPKGFKILLEILADVEGEVEEVGYTFQGRLNGSSSLDWKEAANFLHYVPSLKIRKNRYWD
jgi:dolichol-phosphate mannosyltransferase